MGDAEDRSAARRADAENRAMARRAEHARKRAALIAEDKCPSCGGDGKEDTQSCFVVHKCRQCHGTGKYSEWDEQKAIRSPEAEAYWRGVIAGEIRKMPPHPDAMAHVMLDIADEVDRIRNAPRAAFVRGKTQEG